MNPVHISIYALLSAAIRSVSFNVTTWDSCQVLSHAELAFRGANLRLDEPQKAGYLVPAQDQTRKQGV